MVELTLFEKLWKPVALVLVVLGLLWYVHHDGFKAGEASTQAKWDAETVKVARETEAQRIKTAVINENSQKDLTDENTKLKQSLASQQDYYQHHPVLLPVRVRNHTAGSTGSTSGVPSIPDTAGQPDSTNTDPVSYSGTVDKADFNQLADDCLATTKMLNNAKEWGVKQKAIHDVK
jgi:hypothetical protein